MASRLSLSFFSLRNVQCSPSMTRPAITSQIQSRCTTSSHSTATIQTRCLTSRHNLHNQILLRSSCFSSFSKLNTTSRSFTRLHNLRHPSNSSLPSSNNSQIIRPLVPPPSENSGPLLTRRADRELPALTRPGRLWLKTIPIFLLLITASSLAIFNYQKSSSSTVNSILYALRTNSHVRELLGDEIYFASKVPWIWGELNQLHGIIDIEFWVKGTKGQAVTKFVSVRRKRNGFFETLEWSLKTEDGTVVQLLELEGARDPMATSQVQQLMEVSQEVERQQQ